MSDRRRDRFFAKFRRSSPSPRAPQPQGTTAQLAAPQSQPSTPAPAGSSPSTSTPAQPHRNQALELAIKDHSDKLPNTERNAFLAASKDIDKFLGQVHEYDAQHAQGSRFRPHAERILQLLRVFDRFIGGVAIGIQADPNPSAIIVGGIRVVIDLAIHSMEFFSKLTGMLNQIEDYLAVLAGFDEAGKGPSIVVKAVAGVYGDILEFCQKARDVFVGRDGSRKTWTSLRVFLRQQWEPFEITFGSIRVSMEHHVTVLGLAGQMQQLCNEQNRAREDLLNWISSQDHEEAHEIIHAKKHPGTGAWLLDRKQYRDWMDKSSSALLWCYGKPGAGKSVIASSVLEHLTAQSLVDGKTAVCFAYYNYRNQESQTLKQIGAILLKQLCRQSVTMPAALLSRKQAALQPSLADIEHFLVTLPTDMELKQMFIVIDALDECHEEGRPEIIRLLSELMKGHPCVKVFVTSRRESDIERAFTEMSAPIIQIQAHNVDADIRSFVQDEVRKLRQGYHGKKLFISSDPLEAKVISSLTERADGMQVAFLWVKLQLENLCRVSKARKDCLIDQALNTLPRDIDETYMRIVRRIEEQDDYMRELALNALMWILHAKRPLYVEELQHALAAERTYEAKADLEITPIDVIWEACGNLLIEERGRVRPVHYSVQEFFTTPPRGVTLVILQRRLLGRNAVHTTLASVCLKNLLLQPYSAPCDDITEFICRLDTPPLRLYATLDLDKHLQEISCFSLEILDRLQEFFTQTEERLAAFLQVIMHGGGFHFRFRPTDFAVSASSIIFATRMFEIEEIRIRWLGNTIPPYALCQASIVGSDSAVRYLLESGVSADETDNEGVNALCHAASEGHFKVVALLVEHGADVNVQGGHNGSALQAASIFGDEKIVELLLAKNADVNAQGGKFGNALQAASRRGNGKIVEMLLAKNPDVNAQGGLYGNALQAASYEGEEKIVEILLTEGADVNAIGGKYGTALCAASLCGHEKIVEILLAKGADVNAMGGEYGNALCAASLSGYEKIIEILLAKGADVNAMGGEYGNALCAASLSGRKKIVELLLANNADVNAKHKGGTALQVASGRGYKKIVEMLLARGADVNAQCGQSMTFSRWTWPGGNALYAASRRGYEEIVKLLLANNADVNARHEGVTLLQAAQENGHQEVVDLLLAKGALLES